MFLLLACAAPPDESSKPLGTLPRDTDADTDTDTDSDTDTDTDSDTDTDTDTDTDSDTDTDTDTDPTLDSDGDGYTDLDELDAGTDPDDAASVIYQGGWPYNRDKDALGEPAPDTTPFEVGSQVPRWVWEDQFGDAVDLYDFSEDGRPIVIDLSGLWCYWCTELGALLDGDTSTAWDASYNRLKDVVDRGDVAWITVIDTGLSTSRPATSADLATWYGEFPNPNVTLLLDDGWGWHAWTGAPWYPILVLVEEDMTVGVIDSSTSASNDRSDTIEEVLSRFP